MLHKTCTGTSEACEYSVSIITVIQRHVLRCYGHVLRKDENVWVRKCMDFEVESVRPRSRPKETWTEVTEKHCQI